MNLVYAVSGLGHRSTSSVCMYHNKSFPRAGSKTHSGRLNIYGPPTSRTFPKDLKAVEGLESILQCPMGGYPLDQVTWEMDGKKLNSDLRRKVFPTNGTLVIKKVVKETDEGSYTCTANSRNGRQTAQAEAMLRVIGKYWQIG